MSYFIISLDESETIELAFVQAIPIIYYLATGAVVFTAIGLEALRQANSWDEIFGNSDFEVFTSPEPIVGPLPDIDTSGRFVQPPQESLGDTVLTFPGLDSDSGVDTGTPPFNLEEAIEVNVLDFPNADSYLQDILDGKFEFPTDDGEGGAYFLASEPFSEGIDETTQDLIGVSSVDEVLNSASRPSKKNSETTRGLQALQKRIDGQNSAYSGYSKTQEDVNQIIEETLGASNTNPVISTGKNRNQEARVDIFNPATGRGVRFVNGEFDTFVNLN